MTVVLRRHEDTHLKSAIHSQGEGTQTEPALFTRASGTCSLPTGALLGGASLMAQGVKNLPAMQETQETWIQPLGREDTIEKQMATHSRILA